MVFHAREKMAAGLREIQVNFPDSRYQFNGHVFEKEVVIQIREFLRGRSKKISL
jgi:hypothetical protein